MTVKCWAGSGRGDCNCPVNCPVLYFQPYSSLDRNPVCSHSSRHRSFATAGMLSLISSCRAGTIAMAVCDHAVVCDHAQPPSTAVCDHAQPPSLLAGPAVMDPVAAAQACWCLQHSMRSNNRNLVLCNLSLGACVSAALTVALATAIPRVLAPLVASGEGIAAILLHVSAPFHFNLPS